MTRAEESTPWALIALADQMHVLPRDVVIITVAVIETPHVRPGDRGELTMHATDGGPVALLQLRFGFNDRQALPRTIQHHLAPLLSPERLSTASYVVSTATYEVDAGARRLRRLRQRIYVWTAKWGIDPIRYHDLPPDRTIVMGRTVQLP